MENIPDYVGSIIVPIAVAILGAITALVSSAMNIKNEQSRAAAIIAVISIFVFVLMTTIIGFSFVMDIYSFSHGSADILITNLDGLDSERYRMAEFLRDQARSLPDDLRNLNIAGDTAVMEAKGSNQAFQLGTQWHARVVVWGWYTIVDQLYVKLNLEILNKNNDNPNLDQSIKITAQTDPQTLGAFKFQKQLGSDLSSTIYGLYCYSNGNWDCAIKYFSNAIDNMENYTFTYDDPGVLYLYRGGAYYFNEEYIKAIGDFEKAIRYQNGPSAYYLLGLTYERIKGKTVPAFNSYIIAAEKFNDPNAYERLAIMAGKMNDFAQAVSYYEQAIETGTFMEFGPDNPEEEEIIIESYLHEGMLWQDKKDYKSAQKMYDRIIVMNYEYYDAYYYRGEVYMQTGQTEKAVQDFEKYENNGTNEEMKDNANEYVWYLKNPQLKWFLDLIFHYKQ